MLMDISSEMIHSLLPLFDFRVVFWVAVVPGVLAVILLFFGIQEPQHNVDKIRNNPIDP